MEHLREEELTLFFYRDAKDPMRIQDHLETCASCRAAYSELRASLGALDEYEVPDRPENYGARVWRSVQTRMQIESAARRPLLDWFSLRWARVGWAAAMLLAGFVLGRYLPGPEGEQLRTMRELLTLSLLQNQSASERLAGVSWSRNFDQPDARLLDALVQALNYDPDVNVRLAAIDALSGFSQQSAVRRQLLEGLARQSSPLVQISLIDLLVALREKGSAEALRRLANDEKANEYVRQRAQWGLQQIS